AASCDQCCPARSTGRHHEVVEVDCLASSVPLSNSNSLTAPALLPVTAAENLLQTLACYRDGFSCSRPPAAVASAQRSCSMNGPRSTSPGGYATPRERRSARCSAF